MMSDNKENYNIPYILNGELYKIISRNGKMVTVSCVNCPENKIYRGSIQSTGNFHMHIKRKHPECVDHLHELKMKTLIARREAILRERKNTPTPKPKPKPKSGGPKIKISSTEKSVPIKERNLSPVPRRMYVEGLNTNTAPLDLSLKTTFSVNEDAAVGSPATSATLSCSLTTQEELVSRVETTLKGIQQEMRTRNQLESNRIYFELAKFRFLHPGFNYT